MIRFIWMFIAASRNVFRGHMDDWMSVWKAENSRLENSFVRSCAHSMYSISVCTGCVAIHLIYFVSLLMKYTYVFLPPSLSLYIRVVLTCTGACLGIFAVISFASHWSNIDNTPWLHRHQWRQFYGSDTDFRLCHIHFPYKKLNPTTRRVSNLCLSISVLDFCRANESGALT